MRERSALEVLLTFLNLGLTSFGGPTAHIGYFPEETVVRRRWIDDAKYTDLVALCQFLPGPASSQVGFSLGLIRAGYWGALAAWTGFTLSSAVLLTAFACGAGALGGPIGLGVLHGLKLVAVARGQRDQARLCARVSFAFCDGRDFRHELLARTRGRIARLDHRDGRRISLCVTTRRGAGQARQNARLRLSVGDGERAGYR
jgi:hypothetical protein